MTNHYNRKAIYPRASYFNHSCHGAVARYFLGSRMVLVAARSVAAGEEVHENYGPTFYFKGREERRRHLAARYWFDCGCHPCQRDWPLLKVRSSYWSQTVRRYQNFLLRKAGPFSEMHFVLHSVR